MAAARDQFSGRVKSFGGGPIDANHPQRSAEVVWAGRSASHLQPSAIFFVSPIGVDENVAIAILHASFAHRNFLMPAMLPANRVRLNREGQVLMYAGILPVNPRRIGVTTFEGLNAV